MENNLLDFENREGKKEEIILLNILKTTPEEENFMSSFFYKSSDAKCRYDKLKRILDTTSKEVINSNIYLKSCKEFLDSSVEDCTDILLDYKLDEEKITSITKEVKQVNLLTKYTFKEQSKLKEVETNLNKMFLETYRLQLWNMMQVLTDEKVEVLPCIIKNRENEKVLLQSNFIANRENDNSKIFVIK